MMKSKLITCSLFIILTLFATAQDYEPKMVILAPYTFTYDKTFEEEIDATNKFLREAVNKESKFNRHDSSNLRKQPVNIQAISTSEQEFVKEIDFFNQVSMRAHGYLVYRFYEIFPELWIILSPNNSAGDTSSLNRATAVSKVQYVLNFPSVRLYVLDGMKYAKLHVQLYDSYTSTFLIDTSYIGDWYNPGFEFACADSSIDCTLNNALAPALSDIFKTVAMNSPKLKRQRELASQRFHILNRDYLPAANDKQFLAKILLPTDSNIVLEDQYQIIKNSAQDKFVAFFIKQLPAQNFRSFKDRQTDKHVQIISGSKVTDSSFFGSIPRTYAYIVAGVKYKGEWHYKKANATYFEAENMLQGQQNYFFGLADWNFFKENSTEVNPDFWESGLFKKVPDLTKHPDWAKYGNSSWKTDEVNNRPYIGLYEIVSENLRTQKRAVNKLFDKTISREILLPFLEQYVKEHSLSSYSTMYDKLVLIYPDDKKFVMNPIMLVGKDGSKTIRYFVLQVDNYEIYEWNYFKPLVLPKDTWHYGSIVIDQLSAITDWNFGLYTLDDQNFWDNYVLATENGRYKYLRTANVKKGTYR